VSRKVADLLFQMFFITSAFLRIPKVSHETADAQTSQKRSKQSNSRRHAALSLVWNSEGKTPKLVIYFRHKTEIKQTFFLLLSERILTKRVAFRISK
jgi:hypothetical protein